MNARAPEGPPPVGEQIIEIDEDGKVHYPKRCGECGRPIEYRKRVGRKRKAPPVGDRTQQTVSDTSEADGNPTAGNRPPVSAPGPPVGDAAQKKIEFLVESHAQLSTHHREEIARLKLGDAALREALEIARHELTTLHGLWATDTLNAYRGALKSGCDASGAWKIFVDETWRVDTTRAVSAVDLALLAFAGLDDSTRKRFRELGEVFARSEEKRAARAAQPTGDAERNALALKQIVVLVDAFEAGSCLDEPDVIERARALANGTYPVTAEEAARSTPGADPDNTSTEANK